MAEEVDRGLKPGSSHGKAYFISSIRQKIFMQLGQTMAHFTIFTPTPGSDGK
ncbi:uncharacterized protein G2W53_044144 [Senna tora]|uniref:Uncharacterized protein n=1 Tax=Senna tora TaxID=362788 RepID=A0A834SLV0_9FABA|nr:uncharacterized protein G2W53_044144 [Senna tora]